MYLISHYTTTSHQYLAPIPVTNTSHTSDSHHTTQPPIPGTPLTHITLHNHQYQSPIPGTPLTHITLHNPPIPVTNTWVTNTNQSTDSHHTTQPTNTNQSTDSHHTTQPSIPVTNTSHQYQPHLWLTLNRKNSRFHMMFLRCSLYSVYNHFNYSVFQWKG